MNLHKQLQNGLSLIEAAMVLALSAIVISGVMFYYNSTQSNYYLNTAEETIIAIQQRVMTLYANRNRIDDALSLSMLHMPGIKTVPDNPNIGVLPGNITFKVVHGWIEDGLLPSDTELGVSNRFYVILSGVTPEQCAVLGGGAYGKSGSFRGAYILSDMSYTNISDLNLKQRLEYCSQNDLKKTIGLIFSLAGSD